MASNVQSLHPRSLRHLHHSLQHLVAGRLWVKVLLALVAGLATGVLLGPSVGWVATDTATVIGAWLALPGQVFLALVQMIVMPLVIASIIRGLAASESREQLARLGTRVSAYYVFTTLMAVSIGIAVFSLVQPSVELGTDALRSLEISVDDLAIQPAAAPTAAELPGRIAGLLPTNPLGSMAEGQMLHVVLWAIITGIAILMLPAEQAKPLLSLMGSIQAVSMTIVRWAMWLAPLAVFGLMAKLAMTLGMDVLASMGHYVFTVVLGLALLLAVYMAILRLAGGMEPRRFLRAARENLLLAFSTSSSAAVMPLTVKTAGSLGVRSSIAQFTIPMGTTINMDGTALYQVIAVFFLAASFGVDLAWQDVLLVMVMVLGASIGSPGTPGVGIAILAMTLESVGIPAAGIALILGVDRILDMSRTMCNVTGDLVAAVVMDRWVGGSRGHIDEAVEEQQLDAQRARTGEDVIVHPASGHSSS